MARHELFTIGHSNRGLSQFLILLKEQGVTAIADVRSYPQSRRFPHFDRDALKIELRQQSVDYVFMGDELGARRSERDCYVEGKARYELIAKTPAFQRGLVRLRKGAAKHRIALMCAEKDPLTCHRTILICRHLREEFDVRHILDTAKIETQEQAEARLFDVIGLPSRDLFLSYTELLTQAYDVQAERIAYVEANQDSASQFIARD